MREIKCDHAIEDKKLHPASEYVNIGNLIIGMCGTCYNALRGQVLGKDLERILSVQTISPINITNIPKSKK